MTNKLKGQSRLKADAEDTIHILRVRIQDQLGEYRQGIKLRDFQLLGRLQGEVHHVEIRGVDTLPWGEPGGEFQRRIAQVHRVSQFDVGGELFIPFRILIIQEISVPCDAQSELLANRGEVESDRTLQHVRIIREILRRSAILIRTEIVRQRHRETADLVTQDPIKFVYGSFKIGGSPCAQGQSFV